MRNPLPRPLAKGERVEAYDGTDQHRWRRGTVLDHRPKMGAILIKLDDQDEPAMFWSSRDNIRLIDIVEEIGEIKLDE